MQGHSIGLVLILIGIKTITREPDFYKTTEQRYDETQDTNTFKIFAVPIGNAKNMEENWVQR